MRQTIIGFFNSAGDAERAAERLRSNGFSEADIDITTRHADSNTAGQYTTGEYDSGVRDTEDQSTPYTITDESRYGDTRSRDTLDEGRGSDRKDHDYGFGDSIGRFFRNLFDNKEDAERYANVGRKSCIVSVYADSSAEAERARDILDDCGAVDVDERPRDGSYTDTREVDRSADTDRRNTLSADGVTDKSIPVIEENLNVEKREVESGSVRLRSRIFERPVEENLRLREERVNVERVPVDRPATEADFDAFREGEIEVKETSEVPVVTKEARVVEEVRLNKDVNERDEVVRDSVRKTDVDVEKRGDETVRTKRTDRNKLDDSIDE